MQRLARPLAVGILFVASAPALAGGTPAGTRIDNVATATFDGPGGTPTSVQSNTVSVRVDELIEVSVVSTDAGDVSARNGATNAPLAFRVTNAGNGPEAFRLAGLGAIAGDDFDPNVTSLVLDTNGNGVYDPTIDTVYAAGGNDPLLAPDASVVVFVLSTMPGSAANGARGFGRLTATSNTGTGAPGRVYAGQGQGGGDAVIGTTRGEGAAQGAYAISAINVAFVKSAVVADPFGGTRAVPGSIVTYTLRADVTGAGTLPNLAVSDPIPAGSTYQAGTIQLNGAALTDATDGDAGRFDAGAIRVALGSPAAGTSHLITFKVRIN